MGNHMVRIGLLAVITAVALVTSMTSGIAHAASYAGSARAAASAVAAGSAKAATTASGLAPCTTPQFGGTYHECESTSPTVDRWWDASATASSCTIRQTINWGDGSKVWNRTFVDESPGVHLLASHTYNPKVEATYTETVTLSIVSGPCTGGATYIFEFTHLLSVLPAWWVALHMPKACGEDLLPDPVDVGLNLATLGQVLGLFPITRGWAVLFKTIETIHNVHSVYDVLFKVPNDCVVKAYSLGPLPHAYAYGASHLGKLFKPSGKVPSTPQITGIYGYQKGSLVYFSISYADPGHDAKGFGFVGIKGAGWAEENHPFSNPSYGIVGNHRIDYPFNLECGTPQEYKSYVEAWIYDSHGQRSNPVEVDLSCTT